MNVPQCMTMEEFGRVMEEIEDAGHARALALANAASKMYRPHPTRKMPRKPAARPSWRITCVRTATI